MQLLKFGGSLGTMTGAPGVEAAYPLAATYIQWSNARVLIGLPATAATEPSGTAELEPQPDTARATAPKKAPSAGMVSWILIRRARQ